MLESQCGQFQNAKGRGCANLASITTTSPSLHLDALSTTSKHHCKKCGYSHPHTKYPAKGQQCYACGGYNHFTALCQQKGCHQTTKQTQQRGYQPKCGPSSHHRAPHCTSHSPHRYQCRSPSHGSTSSTPSHSPSHSPSCSTFPKCSAQSNKCLTAHRYYQDALEVIKADSITTGSQGERQALHREHVWWPSCILYHLQLPAWDGTKTMTIKIDPGAQVNTMPLSRCQTLFPKKLTKSRYPKSKALMPTHHTWISHDGLPKPFLGHFIVDVSHATEPKMYPICFYVFEDNTSPHILLSYATLERLGIISFQVPSLAATTSTDHVPLPPPSDKRKTTKQVTFADPIAETVESSMGSSVTPQPAAMERGRPLPSRVKIHWLPAFPRPWTARMKLR